MECWLSTEEWLTNKAHFNKTCLWTVMETYTLYWPLQRRSALTHTWEILNHTVMLSSKNLKLYNKYKNQSFQRKYFCVTIMLWWCVLLCRCCEDFLLSLSHYRLRGGSVWSVISHSTFNVIVILNELTVELTSTNSLAT